MRIIHRVNFDELISLESLFVNWAAFRRDKTGKIDVMVFERHLEDNLFLLNHELRQGIYKHGLYQRFHIYDPKHRIISKARVRDRLVHHLVFKKLYTIFNPTFIYHSYSSRTGKGSHLAVRDLAGALRRESWHFRRRVFALKCDVRKFFDSVSHKKLLQLIENKIKNSHFLWLIREIVQSFSVDKKGQGEREGGLPGKELRGLPIGNLTSQIFANIYLNELDQFVKQKLRVKHYFRYADDFVIVHNDEDYLRGLVNPIQKFLDSLELELHPQKVLIKKFRQGIDFLGCVILPHHAVLRTKTKRRMFRKLFEKVEALKKNEISGESFNQSVRSYLGILKHCNGYELSNLIKNNFLPGFPFPRE